MLATLPRRAKDLTGQRFGTLVAISPAGRLGTRFQWLLRCDCGSEKLMVSCEISRAKSCSKKCPSRVSHRRTHGHASFNSTPTYNSWKGMKQRCENAKDPSYYRYGAKGINVCERWHTFENFLADMGERPEGTTLDRVKTSGNYEPENCRWADMSTQANNRTVSKRYEYQGEVHTVREWSDSLGINLNTLVARVRRYGSMLEAMSRPIVVRAVRRNLSRVSDCES